MSPPPPAAYYNGIRYKAGEKSPHGNTGYGIYVDWETKAEELHISKYKKMATKEEQLQQSWAHDKTPATTRPCCLGHTIVGYLLSIRCGCTPF